MINFLKKIKTFGFGNDPSSHWLWQRITAVLMILIFVWLLFVFQNLLNNFQENFYIWIKNPLNLILFIILIILVMHHSLLGILNIFEDYIHSIKIKRISSIFVKFISLILISISVFSVWHIAH
mgnify:FL=1